MIYEQGNYKFIRPKLKQSPGVLTPITTCEDWLWLDSVAYESTNKSGVCIKAKKITIGQTNCKILKDKIILPITSNDISDPYVDGMIINLSKWNGLDCSANTVFVPNPLELLVIDDSIAFTINSVEIVKPVNYNDKILFYYNIDKTPYYAHLFKIWVSRDLNDRIAVVVDHEGFNMEQI